MATTIILKSIIPIACVSLISFVSLSKCDHLLAKASTIGAGFSTELIHRGSPQYHLYNSSLSPSQLLSNALRRSTNRAQTFNSTQPAGPDITNVGGEYFLNYLIGNPPAQSSGTFDTGSDLIWTQCQPSNNCTTSPLFNPTCSSSYKKITCGNPQCKSLPATTCGKSCQYSVTYGDGSSSKGDLSTDNIMLASGAKSVRNIIFGCEFNNDKQGVVGFGGGKVSLVRQLGQKKFSYCLVPLSGISNSSKLNFGANAVVSGSDVVSAPLAPNKQKSTFYYVTLKGISVGNQKLPFPDRGVNMIVGTGTTATMLPDQLFRNLKKAVVQSLKKLKQAKNHVMELCFYATEKHEKNIKYPTITIHLKGGDVMLNSKDNMFARISESVVCLAAGRATGDAIYGSLAQTNFLVGFDLDKNTVSFKQTKCG